jgi:hypothetical protein
MASSADKHQSRFAGRKQPLGIGECQATLTSSGIDAAERRELRSHPDGGHCAIPPQLCGRKPDSVVTQQGRHTRQGTISAKTRT